MGSSTLSKWTAEENKRFETALAIYDRDSPDRWERVASMVGGGKSVADVKRQYNILVEDIERIESGHVPIPKYRALEHTKTTAVLSEDYQRKLMYLKKLQ